MCERKYIVTIWDSLTGESSEHEARVDPSRTDELLDLLHHYVCKSIGEDPDTWYRYGTVAYHTMDYSTPIAGSGIFRNSKRQISTVSFREVATANSTPGVAA